MCQDERLRPCKRHQVQNRFAGYGRDRPTSSQPNQARPFAFGLRLLASMPAAESNQPPRPRGNPPARRVPPTRRGTVGGLADTATKPAKRKAKGEDLKLKKGAKNNHTGSRDGLSFGVYTKRRRKTATECVFQRFLKKAVFDLKKARFADFARSEKQDARPCDQP